MLVFDAGGVVQRGPPPSLVHGLGVYSQAAATRLVRPAGTRGSGMTERPLEGLRRLRSGKVSRRRSALLTVAYAGLVDCAPAYSLAKSSPTSWSNGSILLVAQQARPRLRRALRRRGVTA